MIRTLGFHGTPSSLHSCTRWLGVTVVLLLAGACAGDGPTLQGRDADADGKLHVVATTEIIADLVDQVGGAHVEARSLVPPGGDPHSYEANPEDAVAVAEADIAFTNHLLLEEQSLIRTIDSSIAPEAQNVSLAENSETYGARVIPLVENISLDTIWLGLRARGDGTGYGADRASQVHLSATDLHGPGEHIAYLTGSLGLPEIYWASSNGFGDDDTVTLPPAAHTHLNWAFTEPGGYRLTLQAELAVDEEAEPVVIGEETFTFAVGVDPATIEFDGEPVVLDEGHSDLAVDVDSDELYVYTDIDGEPDDQQVFSADEVIIEVPNRALTEIPDEAEFSFLGDPGTQIHQLPQAVLGRHVHGEIDPHLWQNVENAMAYVQLIRDTLQETDPANADAYADQAHAYLDELGALQDEVTRSLDTIPDGNRHLITTHDAFAYLADAYDLSIAGFVVPNPAQEPSVAQVQQLSDTIQNLEVPAVFMEPNLAQRSNVLTQVAADVGVDVCTVYGDAFGEDITSYVEMIRHNAQEVAKCLGGENPT